MHDTWIKSMDYHHIPEEDRQPFYDWYCNEYPAGDKMVSDAYKEWKLTSAKA